MRRERRQFLSVVGEQKLLVARVPQPRELALQHDGGSDGHLVKIVWAFAELRAAPVFFDADYAARASYGKPQRRETFNRFWREPLFDIPHGLFRLMDTCPSVK